MEVTLKKLKVQLCYSTELRPCASAANLSRHACDPAGAALLGCARLRQERPHHVGPPSAGNGSDVPFVSAVHWISVL